jgi:hypothetical protein
MWSFRGKLSNDAKEIRIAGRDRPVKASRDLAGNGLSLHFLRRLRSNRRSQGCVIPPRHLNNRPMHWFYPISHFTPEREDGFSISRWHFRGRRLIAPLLCVSVPSGVSIRVLASLLTAPWASWSIVWMCSARGSDLLRIHQKWHNINQKNSCLWIQADIDLQNRPF